MLMSNIGRLKYPQYTISRQTKIFPDRDALFRQVRTSLSPRKCEWNFCQVSGL